MLNKTVFFLLTVSAVFFMTGCDNDLQETESGLGYKIFEDVPGPTAEPGGEVIAHIRYENKVDTLNTFENILPLRIELSEDIYRENTLEEGITMLSEGDSALISVQNKNFYLEERNMPLPKALDPEGYTDIYLKILQVLSPEEVAEQKKAMKQQEKQQLLNKIAAFRESKKSYLDSVEIKQQIFQEEILIQNYMNQNNIKARKVEEGVYLSVQDTGRAPRLEYGDQAVISFTGNTLKGEQFISSDQLSKDSFKVVVGYPQFILGWHEALTYLGEEGNATIVIASPQAYGSEGIKDKVPANEPVIFNIKIEEIVE